MIGPKQAYFVHFNHLLILSFVIGLNIIVEVLITLGYIEYIEGVIQI